MSDFRELNDHAAKLTRQIGLIRTGLGISEIDKKADEIEREVGELRQDNDRLARENEELIDSLKSLISSVENVRLSELPDCFQGFGKKLDVILEAGRARDVPAEAKTTEHVGVAAAPKAGRAEAAAEKETDQPTNSVSRASPPDRYGFVALSQDRPSDRK
jgi:sugar-specific transcriptional regulator TrmB